MFIKAANSRVGTGFTGDVNTAFRQGRQDAYKDYIENFNFALAADVANNAENEKNVQRAAQNYGLNLKFDDATRSAMIDTVKDSTSLANEVYKFGENEAKLNSLYPDQVALGQANAHIYRNDVVTKENTTAFEASGATNKAENASLYNNVENAKQENALNEQQAKAKVEAAKNAKRKWLLLREEPTPEVEKQAELAFIADMRRKKPDLADKSDKEILAMIDPSKRGDIVDAFIDNQIAIEDATIQSFSNEVTKPKDSSKTDKINLGKIELLNTDALQQYVDEPIVGTTTNGYTVKSVPGGVVLITSSGKTGYFVPSVIVNGQLLGWEETLKHNKYKLSGSTPPPNGNDVDPSNLQ